MKDYIVSDPGDEQEYIEVEWSQYYFGEQQMENFMTIIIKH